jgi:predicted anti-sigma-YlaC factor YlaD
MLMSVPPTDCTRARESISAQLDGELSELAAARLSAHLGECPACSAYARDLAAISSRLRRAPLERPSREIVLPRRGGLPAFHGAAAVAAAVAIAAGSLLALSQVVGSPHTSATTTATTPDVVGLEANVVDGHLLATLPYLPPVTLRTDQGAVAV